MANEAAKYPEISYGSGPFVRAFVYIVKFFKSITIEPVVFFYALGFSITIIVSPQLYLEKICTVGSVWFGNGSTYSQETCDNIDNGDHNSTQDYVQKAYLQKFTQDMVMKQSMVQHAVFIY